jgi:hypothetical protein
MLPINPTCAGYAVVVHGKTHMTAKHFEEADNSTALVTEVLSEDAQTRRIELAFFERVVNHAAQASAVQLGAARRRTNVENEVLRELHAVRNPVWQRFALELEKARPAQKDFGQFGSFREPDR